MKFESIRKDLLGVSQSELAKALGMSQSNISMYERKDQTVPPDVARLLIEFARLRGVTLTYDTIYA
jgi:transcriptional regulator with XRE-family HTH domain